MFHDHLGPAEMGDEGALRWLYIESVMSRMRTTFCPCATICRMENGRPSTHMLMWTPMTITLVMPRWRMGGEASAESVMASPSAISSAGCSRDQAR